MSRLEKHIILETTQLRPLAFLFSILLLLGMGKAFQPDVLPSSAYRAAAYQVHIEASQAALLAPPFPSFKEIPGLTPGPNIGGQALPPVTVQTYSNDLPGQVNKIFVFTSGVKRYILFSCLRTDAPPPLSA